jgi:hypothetical protein
MTRCATQSSTLWALPSGPACLMTKCALIGHLSRGAAVIGELGVPAFVNKHALQQRAEYRNRHQWNHPPSVVGGVYGPI